MIDEFDFMWSFVCVDHHLFNINGDNIFSDIVLTLLDVCGGAISSVRTSDCIIYTQHIVIKFILNLYVWQQK